MLLLYCERSLIASAFPTASQTGQHGALAVRLVSHYLDVIHCEEKRRRKKGKHQEWLEERKGEKEREREAEGVKGQLESPRACSHITCFLLRSNLAPFFLSMVRSVRPPDPPAVFS